MQELQPQQVAALAPLPGGSPVEPEQLARLPVARGGPAVLAGGHAGQRDQLAPAEGRPGRLELLPDRLEVLLRVQRAVLARREAEQQRERRLRVVVQLAVAVDGGAGRGLVLAADR